MHCKSLWIKASAKCINVKCFLYKKKYIQWMNKGRLPVWRALRHSSVWSCLWDWCVAPRPLCFARFCASLSATSPDPVSSWRLRGARSRSPEGAGPQGCYGTGLTDRDDRETRKPETRLDSGSFWTTRDYRRPVAENEGWVWQLWQIPEEVRLVRSRMIPNLLNLQRLVGESPAERRCEGKKRQPKRPLTTK